MIVMDKLHDYTFGNIKRLCKVGYIAEDIFIEINRHTMHHHHRLSSSPHAHHPVQTWLGTGKTTPD